MRKYRIAFLKFTSSNFTFLNNCGINVLAVTIGPATSCGKKETKSANLIRLFSTGITLRYTSIV